MEGSSSIYVCPSVEALGRTDRFLDRRLEPQERATYHDWRTKKLKDLIDSDPKQGRRSLADLCRELGLRLSTRQARRLFKLATGVGIRDYARSRRMSAAAARLMTVDMPVKVIAADLGFHNPRQFRRHFKEFFGMSPLEFRKLSVNSHWDCTARQTV